jgi:hypothetical protein
MVFAMIVPSLQNAARITAQPARGVAPAREVLEGKAQKTPNAYAKK